MYVTFDNRSENFIDGYVVVDLSRMTEYYRIMKTADFEKKPQLYECLAKWNARYRAFVMLHFDRASRGGEDWPPLALSTMRAKRRRGIRSPRILINTGLLRNTLDVNMGSPYTRFFTTKVAWDENRSITMSNFGMAVRFYFGGTQHYPDGTAVSDVAKYHHFGKGNLPRRRILVPPDERLLEAMTRDAEVMARALLKHVNTRIH